MIQHNGSYARLTKLSPFPTPTLRPGTATPPPRAWKPAPRNQHPHHFPGANPHRRMTVRPVSKPSAAPTATAPPSTRPSRRAGSRAWPTPWPAASSPCRTPAPSPASSPPASTSAPPGAPAHTNLHPSLDGALRPLSPYCLDVGACPHSRALHQPVTQSPLPQK